MRHHNLNVPMSEPKSARATNVLLELPETLISGLFKHAAPHSLRESEALFQAGDAGDGCYRINTGLVKIVIESQHGEERIVSLQGPGALVGELSMIDGVLALGLGRSHCGLYALIRQPGQVSGV
jgi:CRP/FNR family transcriptional regulator, cyclic AMP receptor protein